MEDVSLSLRKEQLSKPKDFLPKPTEKCWLKTAEREKPGQKSPFGCCQPFFDKNSKYFEERDSFQEFLFSAAPFSVSSDPEFPTRSHASAPDLPKLRCPDPRELHRRRSFLVSVQLSCSSPLGCCPRALPEKGQVS